MSGTYRNTSLALIFKVGSYLLGAVTGLALVRLMSVEDFGRYSYVTGLIGIASVFASLGLVQHFMREMTVDLQNSRVLLRQFFGLQIILSTLIVLTLIFLSFFYEDKIVHRGIIFVSLGLWLAIPANPSTAILFSQGRSELVALEMLSQAFFALILAAIGFFFTLPLSYYFLIPLFSTALRNVESFYIHKRLKNLVLPTFKLSQIFAAFLKGLPYTLIVAINILYMQMDILLFGHLQGPAAVGVYFVAGRLAYVLVFIPYTLGESLVSLFGKNLGDHSVSREIISKYYFYALLICLPIAIGGGFEAKSIVHVFFGERYEDASLPMAIYLWLPVLVCLYVPTNHFLIATGRIWSLVKVATLSLVINAVSNFAVISNLSGRSAMVGSALATLGSELIVIFMSIYLCVKLGAFQFPWIRVFKLLLVQLALFVGILSPFENLFLRVGLAAISYAICAWIFVLHNDERVRLNHSFKAVFRLLPGGRQTASM